MSLTHVDPHVSEIVMVWIQSGDLLMVWIQISLTSSSHPLPPTVQTQPKRKRERGGEDGAEVERAAVVGSMEDGGGGRGRGRGKDEPRGEGQRHQQPRGDAHHERAPEQTPGPRPHHRRLRGGQDRPQAALLLTAEHQGTVYARPTDHRFFVL
jgi:hypothetical protein